MFSASIGRDEPEPEPDAEETKKKQEKGQTLGTNFGDKLWEQTRDKLWGQTPHAPLRGVHAGGLRYPTDVPYEVPRAIPNGTLRLAVYGSMDGPPTAMFGDLRFDKFNSPCGLGNGELIDYRLYPTPMLNESFTSADPPLPPTLVNASSTEQAIFHAMSAW